jgi:hypothetical protein
LKSNNKKKIITDIDHSQDLLLLNSNFKLLIIFMTWILLMILLYLNWPKNLPSVNNTKPVMNVGRIFLNLKKKLYLINFL